MTITIRPLDTASDADLEQYGLLLAACDEERFGGSEASSLDQTRARLEPNPLYDRSLWVAAHEGLEGGESVVGLASCVLPQSENLDQAFVYVCVHPAYRGRGVATALVEEAVRPTVQESGRSKVGGFADVALDTDLEDPQLPAGRIAARLGMTRRSTALCRSLVLPIDSDRLDELAAHAARRTEGYRIVTVEDAIPEEYLEAYGMLLHQLELDDPHEDFEVEAAHFPPERIRDMEARQRAAGQRSVLSIAVGRDGEIVGNSEILVHEAPCTTIAHQENTLVMPEHRGHRLGLALKVANQRRLQEVAPGLRRLVTWNSQVNDAMIAVNEQMGFRPQCRGIAYQGAVADR